MRCGGARHERNTSRIHGELQHGKVSDAEVQPWDDDVREVAVGADEVDRDGGLLRQRVLSKLADSEREQREGTTRRRVGRGEAA